MKAAVFHGVSEGIKIEDVPVPKIERQGDVLIKVHSCGMCGTDLATLEGRHHVNTPIILGHEVAGEIAEVGTNVQTLRPGDHVTVDPNIPCGVCTYCQSNRPSLCKDVISMGERANAGYAEYLLAPQSAVFKFPSSTPWDVIPLAEPLSDVVNGIAKVDLIPGESAVVYGAGPMGLLWLSLLKRSGVGTLISVEPKQMRAEAALKVGADHVVDPTATDPVQEVFRLTDGKGADVAVEAIGRTDTVEKTIESSAYGGRIVIMGRLSPDATARFRPDEILRSEKKIMGTFAGFGYMPLAIECLSKGLIKTEVFVTHKIPLDDIYRAVELNRKGEAIKTLILPP
jgi:threonine dehydrogenase-like Zn-dependent dehydrogenase